MSSVISHFPLKANASSKLLRNHDKSSSQLWLGRNLLTVLKAVATAGELVPNTGLAMEGVPSGDFRRKPQLSIPLK